MAFEPKKYNDIYESMRLQMKGVLSDFEIGSVTRTMFESFAYELGTLYQTMNAVYLSGFVDTAEGMHLDNVIAVLGIQRGLPDYAVGEVTFIRDRSNFDIVIPIGTLVATENRIEKGASTNEATDADKPKEVQRKLYKTIEPAELLKNDTSINVKVQALERGDGMDSEKDMIVVMPRPIVGIKSVKNENPVKLLGRQLETDDELRRRAKNVLLSSGKGDAAAIEKAVLALPEVLSVAVLDRLKQPTPEYGVVDVIVDTPDLEKIRVAVETAVNEVRAAGIYAEIKAVTLIELAGTIVVKPELIVLSADLKADVLNVLETFLRSLRMGQPLSLTKILKILGTIEGIEDIDLSNLKFVKATDNATIPPIDPKIVPKPAPNERFAIGMNEFEKKMKQDAIEKELATLATNKNVEKEAIEKKYASLKSNLESKKKELETKKQELDAKRKFELDWLEKNPPKIPLDTTKDAATTAKDAAIQAIEAAYALATFEHPTKIAELEKQLGDHENQKTGDLKNLAEKYKSKEEGKKGEMTKLEQAFKTRGLIITYN
jgi:uncharacterized phage protein gp47/JayE